MDKLCHQLLFNPKMQDGHVSRGIAFVELLLNVLPGGGQLP